MRTRLTALATALGCLMAGLAVGPLHACSVPVFRYALEQWPPDPYRVAVFHREPLAADVVAWLRGLRQRQEEAGSFPSLLAETIGVDAQGAVPDPWQEMWKAQAGSPLPRLLFLGPQGGELDAVLWAGTPDPTAAQDLLDSPWRREIVRRLIGGDSAVWLFVNSGDESRDRAARQVVEDGLRRAHDELELPPPDDVAEDGGETADAAADRPALTLHFGLLAVDRRAPAPGDAFLLSVLDRLAKPTPGPARGPLAVPVFGRGRALGVYAGEDLGAEDVLDACAFLAGPCSCQVKGWNPGVDLPITADWDGLLRGDVTPPAEPETGVGPASPATGTAAPSPAAAATRAKPAVRPTHPLEARLWRNLWLAAGSLSVLVAVGLGLVLWRRAGRG